MIRKTTLLVFALVFVLTSAQDGEDLTDEALQQAIDDAEQEVIASKKKLHKRGGLVPKFDYNTGIADTDTGKWLGSAALLGFVTWVWMMFFYARSGASDTTMEGKVPLSWFWSGFTNAQLGWTAASYFSFFCFSIVNIHISRQHVIQQLQQQLRW